MARSKGTKIKQLKTKIPTEHEEQVMFVNWLRLQYPQLRFFAVPNGIRTGFKQAIKAKKEGMSSGVPDLIFPKFNLYIEMKRQKGGVISPEQKEWHKYLTEECGHTVIIGKGFVDARDKFTSFLANLTTPIKD